MSQVSLIVCSGFHPPEATQQLIADLSWVASDRPSGPVSDHRLSIHSHPDLALSHQPLAPLSGRTLRQMLQELANPVMFLAFSAGCLAAASAARYWHYQSPNQVLALFAVDGWGVPLAEPYPVHRLSHDRFTHLTSAGQGEHFYADPAVDHLRLWQRPSQVSGIATPGQSPTNAAAFLNHWMAHYCNQLLI